jgi:bifunctional non-homologous end joining protein LigD
MSRPDSGQNGSVQPKGAPGRQASSAQSTAKDEVVLRVEGREVKCTRLSKVLYPQSRTTKAEVIDYYVRVAPFILPHLEDRPVTLKRYPNGVTGQAFWEKDAPSFTPEWVERYPVPRHTGGPDIQYILVQNTATLVWLANAAALELHPFLHRTPEITSPGSIVFDLDPGEGADPLQCIEVAMAIRTVLDRLGLKLFPKVSGSKGLQLYVPLNGHSSYDITQPFARSIAQWIERENPRLAVSEMPKAQRVGKVFIDWSQNADYKTTVGVYSLRAKQERPFVSMPVTWDELTGALKRRKLDQLYFDPKAALARLEKVGDLFADVLKVKQAVPEDLAAAIQVESKREGRTARQLHEYSRKRDFSTTAEPAASVPRPSAQGSRRRFVIQKHAASHLHYDFRLEMHDVLKSWAVPKGVPTESGVRRLASATEDHPIDYLEFEGVIPPGQYGGGTVMVWDIGTYEVVEGNYWKGNLHISLKGKKLKGEWSLSRDRGKGETAWILEKVGQATRPISARRDDASAVTGRTMAQIAAARDATWHSNRTSVPGVNLNELPSSDMRFVEPMLAKPVAELPEESNWQYEIKWDGYRALAIRHGGETALLSRRNNSLALKFPSIVAGLSTLDDGSILDGEIVALDVHGKPSFNLLQHQIEKAGALVYYVFDVLACRGRDVRQSRLTERRGLLNEILQSAREPVRISPILDAAPKDLVSAIKAQGLEGIIAKRIDSRYESGDRSGAWVKLKVNKGQELVIGGFRAGHNNFDNLAVGYYDQRDRLIFIAKIKNGFTPSLKKQIFEQLLEIETKTCPFNNLPEPKTARRGEALTAEAMKKYRWVKPKLVAEVEFTDWTAADHLRHSRFVALRNDKDPKDVHKES